jgi:hypothetical protein
LVVEYPGCALISPLGGVVTLCRCGHAKGFVGALGVELRTPKVKGFLGAADTSGLQLTPDIQVHAFVHTIVLRTPRAAAL